MDSTRFDDLLRSMAHSISRRATIGAALGGLFTSGSLALLGRDAGAKKKHKKKKKKKKKCPTCSECQTCQSGKCVAKPDGTTCSDGTCQAGVCACPPDQVCEIAEICCTDEIGCTASGACFCLEPDQPLCSCPASDIVCPGSEIDSCCLSTDDCDVSGACVTEQCVAGNAFCTAEVAFCGPTCACFTAADDSQVCADIAALDSICPNASQCSTNANCGMGEVCVDVSCCAQSGFVGLCVPECAANRTGERVASRSAALKLPLHAARR